jgi:hypothetical protein
MGSNGSCLPTAALAEREFSPQALKGKANVLERLKAAKAATVRALPGRLRTLGVFHSKSVLYDTFVWARRALKSLKRRFPAWAGGGGGGS